jgi:hypothetical protein
MVVTGEKGDGSPTPLVALSSPGDAEFRSFGRSVLRAVSRSLLCARVTPSQGTSRKKKQKKLIRKKKLYVTVT